MSLQEPKNLENQIWQINNSMMDCQLCPLKETRTQVVPGTGNPQAKIMIIGEAPGRNEDQGGEPFIGAAGKLLNEMLSSIGLNRADIYITNVVKCRPPQNRDPLPFEIHSCLPYLKSQILAINPQVIVTLGRFAMNIFIPGAQISQLHGQIQKIDQLSIIPLYHPAAAIYQQKLKATLFQDFQKIKEFLN